MLRITWLAGVPMVVAGCSLFGLDETRVIGRIDETDPARPVFVVPDSVDLAAPFTVRILTTGDGCDRGGDTEVSVEGSRLRVTPYDFSRTSGHCGSLQVFFEHDLEYTPTVAGSLTVRLVARDLGGAPIERQASVWVR